MEYRLIKIKNDEKIFIVQKRITLGRVKLFWTDIKFDNKIFITFKKELKNAKVNKKDSIFFYSKKEAKKFMKKLNKLKENKVNSKLYSVYNE